MLLLTLQPRDGDRKSELLPTGWNTSGELYTLRYRSNDDKSNLLFKAITVDSTLIFNVMVSFIQMGIFVLTDNSS